MKNFLIVSVLCVSLTACAQKNPVQNIAALQASGSYSEKEGKIYVDENLKQTSKSSAAYYLEKQLLGQDLVPNDSNSGNYWQDRKYFSDTPIVRYIYKYYDVKDGKLAFASSVAEWQGKPNYLFDGVAFYSNKKDIVTKKLNFTRGKLSGEVAEYNDDGTFKSRKILKDGKDTGFVQDVSSLNSYFFGTWETTLPSDAAWQETVLVNIYNDDGTIDVYKDMFYKSDQGRTQTMNGSDNKATAFWVYKPKDSKSGTVEYYFAGEKIQTNEFLMKDKNTMVLKVLYTNPKYTDDKIKSYIMTRR